MYVYIVAVTARWLCMHLNVVIIVLSSCLPAPCAGTMLCTYYSQSSRFCSMGRPGRQSVASACCKVGGVVVCVVPQSAVVSAVSVSTLSIYILGRVGQANGP